MFIYIGNDNVIQSDKIISIIDYSVITSSSIMGKMVEEANVVKSLRKPKSVVITSEMIYYSSLSVSTLKKRTGVSSIVRKVESYMEE